LIKELCKEKGISISELSRRIGQTPQNLSKKSYATEDERSIFYADHAINEICKYLAKGEVLEMGMQAWY
jgi:transcriptional regulator with XRE-family HTH domain